VERERPALLSSAPPGPAVRFLDGLEVIEPGLVPCAPWRPAPGAGARELREVDEYGAVARKH